VLTTIIYSLATYDSNLDVWLLEHDANPNALDFRCQKSIDCAAYAERLESVKLSVNGGTNMIECLALIAVMMAEEFREDIARYLLAQGVNNNILERNIDGDGNEREIPTSYFGSALHVHRAIEKKNTVRVRWLLQNGADRNIKSLPPFRTQLLQLTEWDDLNEIAEILRTEHL